MGVAGDMFGGALLSLLSQEEQDAFITEFNNIGIPKVRVFALKSCSTGISGTKLQVLIDGEEEHHHEHHHTDLGEIEHIVSHLKVSEDIKKDIINIYNIIADVTFTTMLIHKISPDTIISGLCFYGYCATGY